MEAHSSSEPRKLHHASSWRVFSTTAAEFCIPLKFITVAENPCTSKAILSFLSAEWSWALKLLRIQPRVYFKETRASPTKKTQTFFISYLNTQNVCFSVFLLRHCTEVRGKKNFRPPAVSLIYPLLQGWLDFTAGIIKFPSNLIQMDWPSESRWKVEYLIDFLLFNASGCDRRERQLRKRPCILWMKSFK